MRPRAPAVLEDQGISAGASSFSSILVGVSQGLLGILADRDLTATCHRLLEKKELLLEVKMVSLGICLALPLQGPVGSDLQDEDTSQ